jgi:hypothetical protein
VVVDAKEGRDVMTAGVPNAFIQTKMPEMKKGDERVIMKITGVLVDLMVELAPDIYRPYVVTEGGKRVLSLASSHGSIWDVGGGTSVVQEVQR